MSNLITHAEIELKMAGFDKKDSEDGIYDGMLYDSVMELIKVFSKQGHSGMSAGIVRSVFNKLANFEPLQPLTFKDEEWGLTDNKESYQNKRLSSVFKEGKNGNPYYLMAIVFKDQNGSTFTQGYGIDGITSFQYIDTSKPFVPKTFYCDVISTEVAKDDWEHKIKDRSQLIPVFEYYKQGFKGMNTI